MASSEKRLTEAEIIKIHQSASREIACSAAANGKGPCLFCPWKSKDIK